MFYNKKHIYFCLFFLQSSYVYAINCSKLDDIIKSDNVFSYIAKEKIYFYRYCDDNINLCKTNNYIISGDYFIASQHGDYLCASYIKEGYNSVKAIGLIKSKNYITLPMSEYFSLLGNWTNKYKNIKKTVILNISANKLSIYGESKSPLDNYQNYFDGNILKIGIHSYIAITTDGFYNVEINSNTLILNDHGDTGARYPEYGFSGKYNKF